MRELSCFREAAVCAASPASVSGAGGLDRSLQAATTSVYHAQLASGKGVLIRVTWTRSSAAATGIAAITFSDEGSSVLFSSPSSSAGTAQLRRKRGSRGFVTDAGTAVGVHWDVAAAEYASTSSPEPYGGDYYLAVVADAQLVLLLGSGGLARRLSSSLPTTTTLVSRREQQRSTGAAIIEHATRCRFREGGEEHSIALWMSTGGEGEVGVSIDGEEVAVARRLGWGFRGNSAAVLPDGEVVDVMWDVHDWWFGSRAGSNGKGAQFMVRARAEKEGRLWMADQTAPAAKVDGAGGGFFLHVQCYRR